MGKSNMERDTNRADWQAAAESREWIRGNKPEDPEPYYHTGLVEDDRIRRILTRIQQAYDPDGDDELPGDVRETEIYRRLLRAGATESMTRAIYDGRPVAQSYMVGDPAARSDISGIKAIEELRTVILRSAPIVYIFGEPGSGKTNFALLLTQLWKREYGADAEVGTNIRTWDESDRWIPNYGRLRNWLEQQIDNIEGGGETRAEDADPRLFVFDEASSHASGRGAQGAEAGEKLGPLVYKIRKANAGIIIIGHDGRDVHPAVRTLSTVVQRYRGEMKRATVWEDVKNREGRGKIMDLKGIPETDYSYDDGEATSWSWEDTRSVEDELVPESRAESMAVDIAEQMTTEQVRRFAAKLASGDYGLTQKEIGESIGEAYRGEKFSQDWVSKWKGEYGGSDLGVIEDDDRDGGEP